MAQAGVEHITADVTDGDSLKAAVSGVIDRFGRIDALVNNAGCGIFGAAEFTDIEAAERQFDVNFFGAVRLATLVAGHMRLNGGGAIVNVASLAAMMPLPFQSFYSASKAALLCWTRAFSGEVSRFGIRVSAVCPGDVRTGFTAARSFDGKGDGEYGGAVSRALAKAEASERRGCGPDVVARAIFRQAVSRRPKLVAVPGAGWSALDAVARILPRGLVSRLVGRIYA